MAKYFMMRWYPDAHLADTATLSLEERGAYRDLQDYMWLAGGWLKDDDKEIARLLRITKMHWLKIKPNLKKYFIYANGLFTQKRLLNNLGEAKELSETNRKNGKIGGLKRVQNITSSLASAKAENQADCVPSIKANGSRPVGEVLESLPDPLRDRFMN